jgi:hypothetical protein
MSQFWCTESNGKPNRQRISADQQLLVTDATKFVNTQKQWKMENRISVLFYARKSKKTSKVEIMLPFDHLIII